MHRSVLFDHDTIISEKIIIFHTTVQREIELKYYLIVRYLSDDWHIVQQLVALKMLQKSLKREETAHEIISLLSIDYWKLCNFHTFSKCIPCSGSANLSHNYMCGWGSEVNFPPRDGRYGRILLAIEHVVSDQSFHIPVEPAATVLGVDKSVLEWASKEENQSIFAKFERNIMAKLHLCLGDCLFKLSIFSFVALTICYECQRSLQPVGVIF